MPSKRRSWLPFSRSKPNKSTDTEQPVAENTGAPPSSFKQPEGNNTDRYRPIQFSPNRLQTLYVTPSERNLYLAAMSQLDENPPHLALWSDPAPSLPQISHTPPITSPQDQDAGAGGWPRDPSILSSRDPRLVTSPEARTNGGLMVREEFRRLAPAKQVQHASMALTGGGGMRFTRFPANVLMEVEKLFPPNKVVTETTEGLTAMGNGVVAFWKVKMFGSMWKRTGAEELDPIRLLIAIIECLGSHGWTVVSSIRAGGRKADVQNLLFTYSSETATNPPAYFALSFPVPDRISLVSPPPKATPALLSAIRNAITSTSAGQQRSGTGNSTDNQEQGKKRVSWHDRKAKIKVEGWVYDGVYRFWLDGLRRKIVGGVKRDAVEFLQPHVVLNIISALSSLQNSFAASIPLQPFSAGRDILLFSTQPETGVTAKDAYKPKPAQSPSPATDGSQSPVLVDRTASFPLPTEDLNLDDPRTVDPDRRRLPWTSTVQESEQPSRSHTRSVSENHNESNLTSRAPSAQNQHRRNISLDSTQPLIKPKSASAQSSPRPRNVLLKKASLRRNGSNLSTVRNQSLAPRSRRTSDGAINPVNARRDETGRRVQGDASDNGESWLVVDPPVKVGHMGLTMYTDDPDRQSADDTEELDHHIPATQVTTLGPEMGYGHSQDDHASSGDSGYTTPPAHPAVPPRLPPRRMSQAPQQPQQLNTTNLPLGNPMPREDTSMVSSVPAFLPLKSPQSPNRVYQAERVDIGIPSVHGSLGYIPSMMSAAPSNISHDPMPTSTSHGQDGIPGEQERYDDALSHMPGGLGIDDVEMDGSGSGEDRKGKAREGARRIWDEDRGVWVEGVTPYSTGPDGPGSARTRVSLR